MTEQFIIIVSALGVLTSLFFLVVALKTKHGGSELSPLATGQISEFGDSSHKLSELGQSRDAKVYKALELAVYCTGSPILSTPDSSYPLMNQPGYISSLSDVELDELIASLKSMTDEERREAYERAKLRKPPRFSSFDVKQYLYLYANNLIDPSVARESLAAHLLYIHVKTLAEQNPEMMGYMIQHNPQ